MPAQAFVRSPSDGERFVVGPFTLVSRVECSQSDGLFEMWELSLGPATIDYHVHREMDETLTVLEGVIRFDVAGESYLRPAGSTAFVPRGIHHGFTNPGPDPARVLILFTPGGNQTEYFRQLEQLFAGGTPDMDAVQRLQKQYDQELVPPD